jgi:hypothetical protein
MPRRAGKSNLRAVRDGTRVLRTVLRGRRSRLSDQPLEIPAEHGTSKRLANASRPEVVDEQ